MLLKEREKKPYYNKERKSEPKEIGEDERIGIEMSLSMESHIGSRDSWHVGIGVTSLPRRIHGMVCHMIQTTRVRESYTQGKIQGSLNSVFMSL